MKRNLIKIVLFALLAVVAVSLLSAITIAVTEDDGEIYRYVTGESSENGYAQSYLVNEKGETVTLDGVAAENSAAMFSLFSLDSSTAEDYALPESYDSRDYGYISPVKSQQGGTCWTHAATGCMEASYIKQGLTEIPNPDFSEMHIAWSYYFQKTDNTDDPTYGDGTNRTDMPISMGGDEQAVLSVLSRWSGMANDADYPQKSTIYATRQHYIKNMTYADRYAAAVHLENYVELPNSISDIKQAIIDNGAVGISYSSSGKNYPYYYYPEGSIDHSIIIVGWDDSISREQFGETYQPSQNGAWLCKNSWGVSHGFNGYFWMSYDQTPFARIFYYSADADFYDNNYQYCGSLASFYSFKSTDEAASANVFTAKSNETLKAVGAYLPIRDTDYTIEIYTGLPSSFSNPVTNGTLAATVTGYKKYSGYYTIDLDEPVKLSEGEVFSVVLKTSNDWTVSRFVALGNPYNEHYETGRGYVYKSGQWRDAATYHLNDVYIRAFTENEYEAGFFVSFNKCTGEEISTVLSDENGCVELPAAPDGTEYVFTCNGAAFDGTSVKSDMNITVHCYSPDKLVPNSESVCRLECKCEFCGKVLFNQASHSFEETVINDWKCRRTESLCTVCGYYKTDFEFPAGSKNGMINDHMAWYLSEGCLYIVGRGDMVSTVASTVSPDDGWQSKINEIYSCRIGDEITSIKKEFLSGAKNLVSVEIPEGITEIPANAFSAAISLSKINLPSTVTKISSNAFSSTAITSLHIPENVKIIDDGAFNACNNLVTLTGLEGICEIGERVFLSSRIEGTVYLPSTLERLGYGAFSNTPNLTALVIDPACKNYVTYPEGYVMSADGKELLFYSRFCENEVFLVPETVEVIADHVFRNNTNIKYIDMPSVTTVGISAFENSALEGVGFGSENSITINLGAFRNALNLKKLYLPANVNTIQAFALGYTTLNKVNSDFTLYCESGSKAETFASGNKINYLSSHTEHVMERIPILLATCQNNGISFMLCSECAHVDNAYEEYSVNGAHTYNWITDTEATCTESGLKHGVCIYCGFAGEFNTVVPPTGHSFEWVTDVEVTCETDGLRHEKCSVCGLVQSQNTVTEATGHTFEWIIDKRNTCGFDGVKHEECQVCGKIQSEGTAIPAHGAHPMFRNDYACFPSGNIYYGYKCIDCNYIQGDSKFIGNHSSSAYYTDSYIVEPTCMQSGTAVSACKYCGEIVNNTVRTVAALGHSYEYVTETAPNCVTKGVKREKCTRCGGWGNNTISVAATGIHTYEWIIDVDSDCVNTGLKHKECVNCDAIAEENTVIATKNHNYAWVTDRQPTCSLVGIQHRECSGCGAIGAENTEIAMTAHAYEWVTDIEPSCGINGIKYQICLNCNATCNENTVIAATGNHSYQWVTDVEADCVNNGIKHKYCAVCDSVAQRNTVIPSWGGHDFQLTYNESATCTQEGGEIISCTRCGEVESEKIYLPLGHSYGIWSESEYDPETETFNGSRTCDRCGCVQYRTYVAGNVINLIDFLELIIERFVEFLKNIRI